MAASLTLEQLAALSDEIAALARAGLPLERGLAAVAAEMPGRIARIAEDLSKRTAAGEDLAKVLQSRPDIFPPAFRAVLEAGARSGRIPAALDSVSRSARVLADLRQTIRIAWIYPILILVAGYLLLWVMMVTMPTIWTFLREIDVPPSGWERLLQWLQERRLYWYPALGVIGLAMLVWDMTRRSSGHDLYAAPHKRVNGWHAARVLSQQAAFCELMAVLIEHHTPMPQAFSLAAEATHSPGEFARFQDISARLARGETAALQDAPLPALVTWVLQLPESPAKSALKLRKLSGFFRRDADRRVAWAGVRIPIVLTLVIGGPTVVLFAAVFLLPWMRLLRRLLEPSFT